MAERTVLIAGFAYTEERPLLFDAEGRITSDEEIGTPVTDEHGEPVILKIRHLAKYGETVDFSDADIARGEEIGAFDPPPMHATRVSGKRPSASIICSRTSRPTMAWKSRTMTG